MGVTNKRHIKVYVTDSLYEAIYSASGGGKKLSNYLLGLAEKDLKARKIPFEGMPELGDINFIPSRRRSTLLEINSEMAIAEISVPPQSYNQRLDYPDLDMTAYLRGQNWNEDLIEQAKAVIQKYNEDSVPLF